jgi:hypothetical protein
MAGTITATTIQNDTSSPPTFRNNSVEIGRLCRAWVNFEGSTAAIRGSFNVSSVTRNSSGNWTINFTTAMPNANYAFTGTGSLTANEGVLQPAETLATYLAGSVRCVFYDTGAYRDPHTVSVAIFSS